MPIYTKNNAIRQQYDRYKKIKNSSQKYRQKWGTNSEIINWVINLVLAVATISLFFITRQALCEARKANDISKQALKNSIESGKAADVRADTALAIQKRAVDAQIQSLKQTQNDFEMENRPLPMVSGIVVRDLKTLDITFQIFNYGKQPAKAISLSISGAHEFYPNYTDFKTLSSYPLENVYLQSVGSKTIFLKSTEPLSAANVQAIKDGKMYFFILGKLRYLNTVTTKTREYIFDYRMYYNPNLVIESVIDKDIEFEKTK